MEGVKTRLPATIAKVLLAAAIVLPHGAQAGGEENGRAVHSVGWFRRHFGRLTWEEIVNCSESPRDVAAFVGRQVRYEQDEGDEWSNGRTVMERGYGDCEDYAAAVVELCREKGFDARFLVFFDAEHQAGHAVAAGEWRGRMWVSSNGAFAQVRSFEEIRRVVARELGVRPSAVVQIPESAVRAMRVAEKTR